MTTKELSVSHDADETRTEQAMLAALDPGSAAHAQANVYCENLRESGDGWRVCVGLACNRMRAPEARFVALQVVEALFTRGRYSTLAPSDRAWLRQSIFSVIAESIRTDVPVYTSQSSNSIQSANSSNASPSNFLRNKFMHLLVLMLRFDYIPHPITNSPPEWPSFFTDFLSLPRTRTFTNTFLHLCFSIHDEVASREMSYDAETHTANILIKDCMRAQGIPASLVSTWFQMLSDALTTQDHQTAAGCLRCIGLYVSWIDAVNLVLPNKQFIDALLGFLSPSTPNPLRMGGLSCLMGLVEKGMPVSDKLAVFDLLGATSRILESIGVGTSDAANGAVGDNEDDFEDLACKYVNLCGMELCKAWDNAALPPASAIASSSLSSGASMPDLSSISNTSNSCGLLRSRILRYIQKLLPHAVRVMRSEFDDVSSLLFPFLDEYLRILKDCKKDGALNEVPPLSSLPSADYMGNEEAKLFVDESLVGLLGVVVTKMKYDEDEEYDFVGGGGDDEALFYQMRQTLRSKMETIILIDSQMFFQHFSAVVTNTFDAITMATRNGQRVQDVVRWSEAELALYLLYIYKGPFVYVNPEDNAPTAFNAILVKMMQSNISAYPHPSIPLVFFETVVKYGLFFNNVNAANTDFLPQVLESFADARGLHNPSSTVRSRVDYLFMRFVKEIKELKGKMKMYAGPLVEAIKDVLYIIPPQMQQPNVLANAQKQQLGSSIFDNQLYVFEAVGFLISLDEAAANQERLLQAILNPLMTSMQEILDTEMYKLDTAENPAVTNYMRQLITAVGSVGKGFPDYDVSTKTVQSSPLWARVFKQALHRIILVLQTLNGFEVIRESARFAFQRMIGCVGDEILLFFQPLITAGLFTHCSTKELANFLPSVDLLMHKFKAAFLPILNDIFVPLVERIFYFLNQAVTGFDEMNEMNDLRRSYFNLMNNIFVHDLMDVLISDTNSKHFNTVLQSTLHYGGDPSDTAAQKLALSLLSKMVAVWGSEATNPLAKPLIPGAAPLPAQQPATTVINGLSHSPLLENAKYWKAGMVTASAPTKAEKKAAGMGGKEVIAIGLGGRRPLPNFSNFIYESMMPLLFAIPRNEKFNIADGAAQLVVFEIANCHKTILIVQGVEYLRVVEEFLETQMGWRRDAAREFSAALVDMSTRQFQAALKKSFAR
ncbi:pre-tRNA nuclear export protein [Chytriomyces hyalinus]|nr:pre-tRNA nuclear export protein [Chytriomyces hyalinus]